MNLFQEIYSFIQNNPGLSFSVTFTFTFILWMYKQNNSILQNDRKIASDNLHKKINAYSQLESTIALFIKKDRSEDLHIEQMLYTSLGNAVPHVSETSLRMIREFYNDNEYSRLKSLLFLIQQELNHIKSVYFSYQHESNSNDFIEIIIKLIRPAKPIVYLFIIILFATVQFITMNEQNNFYGKVNIYCQSLSIFYGFIILVFFINALFDRKILNNPPKKYFIMILAIVLIPIVSLFVSYVSIYIFLIQIVVTILLFRFTKMKKTLLI